MLLFLISTLQKENGSYWVSWVLPERSCVGTWHVGEQANTHLKSDLNFGLFKQYFLLLISFLYAFLKLCIESC